MDATQAKIIELLREVHMLALKEIERLNLRVAELETMNRQPTEQAIPEPAARRTPSSPPGTDKTTIRATCARTAQRASDRRVRPTERCQRAPLAALSHGSEIFEDRCCRALSTGGC